jgi:phospholipid transport system transporter-binding protein
MIVRDGDRLRVAGPITLATVGALRAEGLALLAGPAVRVDLAGAQEVDSSALSLLLEWARAARAAGGRLTFENLPANLQALARLYGVLELLEPAG